MKECSVGLQSLPEDILLEIAFCLAVTDILALKQTCRVLHTFGCMDYLWRWITSNMDLPLNIPSNPSCSLSGNKLQEVVLRAMRLDSNWRNPTSQIKRVNALPQIELQSKEAPFAGMQLTKGGDWMVTAQPLRTGNRWYTRMTLWSLVNIDDIYRIGTIDIIGFLGEFSLDLREHAFRADLAVTVNHQFVEVHLIDLRNRVNDLNNCSLRAIEPPERFVLDAPPGTEVQITISAISIHNGVLAATVACLDNDGMNPQRSVFIAKINNNVRRWIHSQFTEPFSDLWVRLYGEHIYLLGKIADNIVLRIYQLPILLSEIPHGDSSDTIISIGAILAEYKVPCAKPLSILPIHDCAYVAPISVSFATILIFYPLSNGSDEVGQIIRFPNIGSSKGGHVSSHKIILRPGVSSALPNVGPTGHRAVWLERDWDTGRSWIRKLDVKDGVPIVETLISSDPELPFKPDSCRALAFDEVSGRVCVSLYDGNMYIIDLV